MKLSKKHQAIEKKNSDFCAVTEHPINDQMIDFAIAKISGRYPDTQRVSNLVCKEIVYIQEGNGKVVVDGNEHLINAGDVILIEAGEKYYWEGNMQLLISCTPAFTIEQHQIVD